MGALDAHAYSVSLGAFGKGFNGMATRLHRSTGYSTENQHPALSLAPSNGDQSTPIGFSTKAMKYMLHWLFVSRYKYGIGPVDRAVPTPIVYSCHDDGGLRM